MRKVLTNTPEDFLRAIEANHNALPKKIDVRQEEVARGLARLVLTLVELLRELLERQALRRMEGGTLTREEINNLGITFMELSKRMEELKRHFGLRDEELNIDLGPLGRLLES